MWLPIRPSKCSYQAFTECSQRIDCPNSSKQTSQTCREKGTICSSTWNSWNSWSRKQRWVDRIKTPCQKNKERKTEGRKNLRILWKGFCNKPKTKNAFQGNISKSPIHELHIYVAYSCRQNLITRIPITETICLQTSYQHLSINQARCRHAHIKAEYRQ